MKTFLPSPTAAAVLLSLFFFAPVLHAQQYGPGHKDLQFGIGLLPTFYGSGYRVGLPPVSASLEVGVAENIGIGGFAAFSTARTKKINYGSGEYWWRWTYIILGARGAYHLDLDVEKLDPYVGLMAGFRIATSQYHATGTFTEPDIDNDAGLAYSLYAGARYRATDNLRIFGELGYGLAVATVGINFKLSGGE